MIVADATCVADPQMKGTEMANEVSERGTGGAVLAATVMIIAGWWDPFKVSC